jgi:hypothetical protein
VHNVEYRRNEYPLPTSNIWLLKIQVYMIAK